MLHGCARKILRLIRNEPFDLKVGLIPSDNSQVYNFGKEFLIASIKMCSRAGKVAALSFMKWIGMDIDFIDAPMPRHFIVNAEKLVNIRYLEITATLQISRPFTAC
ncbi:hypothetical protein H5410_000899 [Solanum commersonii]|uniref:Uncharacterized protein n=1 Tax=Solanum commersonii TaxID=4109 RepID=A0A9J6AXD1_SOLCO|nr:hypothetical protein H5410_000899 [Solanum commersonii]